MLLFHALKIIGAAFALVLISPGPAYAYLDPGTTSMILQVVISVFVGGAIAAKVYWNKLKIFFSGFRKEDKETGD